MTTIAPMNAFLEVRSVAKAFGGNQVLSDVNIQIAQGEIVGLLGPNGSGKSTLLNVITGFTPADAGSVHFAGTPIERLAAHRIVRTGMARTPQLPSMPTRMSVMEVAMAAATAHHGVWDTPTGHARRPPCRARCPRPGRAPAAGDLLLTPVRDLPASAISRRAEEARGHRHPRLHGAAAHAAARRAQSGH
ncbi:ATP-binding cassette domain-containing protein [Acidovorax sp.]|uniref:ATP-binding cassette domain-containing protein n=1 Tax=Acidovorax sp. TaxID=1872122 RepID=UPI002ACD9515|nr:ATP-binding cassette domain-containing protein [Acidovorax sp.]MDZ7863250.1 ATP-binding cassette domain-containing protein [Acidovorax sp.]